MSNTRIFFAGVGTTFLLIGAGFGSGLMFAKTAMDPAAQTRITAADKLPPVRVILPASAEPAPSPLQLATPAADPVPGPQRSPQVIPVSEVEAQAVEKDRHAERAEQRKAEAAERDRRKRTAERKARREAARAQQLQEQQQQDARRQARPGIMAFGGDDEPSKTGGFFGN